MIQRSAARPIGIARKARHIYLQQVIGTSESLGAVAIRAPRRGRETKPRKALAEANSYNRQA